MRLGPPAAVTPADGPLVVFAVDVQGRIVPVVDLRRLLGLPHRQPDVDDVLVVARAAEEAP